MYSQPLNLDISPSWDISNQASESAMLESSLSQQILTDSSLSPLEKVEQLKEKSAEESYREILGLVLSCHLAELHGGSIVIQGSLQSGYRYIFRLPKIETHEN